MPEQEIPPPDFDFDYLTDIDFIEVGRRAYELGAMCGPSSLTYAVTLARRALANGSRDEFEFWRSVMMALTPRSVTA